MRRIKRRPRFLDFRDLLLRVVRERVPEAVEHVFRFEIPEGLKLDPFAVWSVSCWTVCFIRAKERSRVLSVKRVNRRGCQNKSMYAGQPRPTFPNHLPRDVREPIYDIILRPEYPPGCCLSEEVG